MRRKKEKRKKKLTLTITSYTVLTLDSRLFCLGLGFNILSR